MAYQNIQQQTTEAHSAYLKVMAESHLSFLRAAESSNIAFSALLTGHLPVTGEADLSTLNTHAGIAAPEFLSPAPSAPEYAQAPVPPVPEPKTAHSAPAPLAVAPAEASPVQSSPALAGHTPVSGNVEFKEMLLNVVAEKTGYPKEILTLDMNLELDLGIDSIKRVEIFSAINE
ncbi:MAG: hypothetical protein COX19_14210, partial [Desulfobacterales bacterium CG23_combo_of_CG06-09_8_20_14_all_51_8]